jgi:arylformamidase
MTVERGARPCYSERMNDTSTTAIVWGGMNRRQLDDAYDNGKACPDSAERRDGWIARSAQVRAERPELLDLAYGPRERNRVDVFRSGRADAPLFAFIHGDVAMIGYTLCPDVTLTELVAETHAAIRFLRKEGPKRGFGTGKLVVSGWSAGGHLTASALPLDEVDAGLAISGIYDVEPCRLNYLNEKLKLTADEARATSPILHLTKRRAPLTVAFGTGELPELQRQSRDYHQARLDAALPSTLLPLAPHNHFSIMEELRAPGGKLNGALNNLIVALS